MGRQKILKSLIADIPELNIISPKYQHRHLQNMELQKLNIT